MERWVLKKGVKVHYAFCLSVLNPNVNSSTLGVGWVMFYYSTVEDRSTTQRRRKRKNLTAPGLTMNWHPSGFLQAFAHGLYRSGSALILIGCIMHWQTCVFKPASWAAKNAGPRLARISTWDHPILYMLLPKTRVGIFSTNWFLSWKKVGNQKKSLLLYQFQKLK